LPRKMVLAFHASHPEAAKDAKLNKKRRKWELDSIPFSPEAYLPGGFLTVYRS
jgi:hypothetical protein